MKITQLATAALLTAFAILAAIIWTGCSKPVDKGPWLVDDDGGKKLDDFPELAADVFAKMDAPLKFDPSKPEDLAAIKGRNTWNLWSGGNQTFWDRMARESYGLIDLLKTLDSRKRSSRFSEMGLINQPGYTQATKPDEFGLWIDEVVEPEPAEIDPKVFGKPSGVMGFRLFPNPDFKGDAVRKWDAERFYTDENYANDKTLVRPYRVGVSCGSCHIAFHPLFPPADPVNPKWENLSSIIGNQYIHEGRTFAHNVKPGGFFWEMTQTQPRGTSDTSRIATDNINNPNTINGIFLLGARAALGHQETVSKETALLPGDEGPNSEPRVLKDGADSVGVMGATVRVYINIGTFSQHWLRQHNALIGLVKQRPFSIETAQEYSVFWNANERNAPNIAAFFQRVQPMRLTDAPDGAKYVTTDEAVLKRGKAVFAQECARCHSSKRPQQGEDAKEWFTREVMKPDFLENNFLSDEQRYSVTELETNSARACATNAMKGHIWDVFSSNDYKAQKSPGTIKVYNPYADREEDVAFKIPGNGPGYYRTPSLIAIWTSAPFLHNNALGKYNGDPSVAGRMAAFDDAIGKLLWPERRLDKQSIWRTSQECKLQIHNAVLPEGLRELLQRAGQIDDDGYFRIGHIPAGTPVNLLANVDPDASKRKLLKLFVKIKRAMLHMHTQKMDDAAKKEYMKTHVAPALFEVSKCPDLIEDRGHYFGTHRSDEDKKALIEFLKLM